MQLKILLFGPQAALANRREIELTLSDEPVMVSEVLEAIAKAFPQLGDTLSKSRLAINQEFATPDQVVPAGAEVALIGMVSGG